VTVAYTRPWGTGHPGLLIILIDQSDSMKEAFGGASGGTKAEAVARSVNDTIEEMLAMAAKGATLAERFHMSVLSYSGHGVQNALGGSLADHPWVNPVQLEANPLRVEPAPEDRDAVNVAVWVEPRTYGNTPMSAAFDAARDVASKWAAEHPGSFPPLVVNITDGVPTDGTPKGDPTAAARRLLEVSTDDGALLLFNCHISGTEGGEVKFPSHPAVLPPDPYARRLFEISSFVPGSCHPAIYGLTGMMLDSDSRAFVFNGNASTVRTMLQAGTTGPLMLQAGTAAGTSPKDE
jgi:hypothetical protein